ncbi:MAG: lactate utilization protein [Erysipelotrichaceae bacterium]|nr:lactate utilization protein [Erysipelotrichaceae bacterium]
MKPYDQMTMTKLEKTREALLKKHFAASVVGNCLEARELVRSLIGEGQSVCFGGSMTLQESGILDMVYGMNVKIYDRYKEGLSREDANLLYRQSFMADVLLTSSNAVTMTGELYNIDGTGNRVAAMIFGPDKVICVVGRNKVVTDEEAAVDRVRNVAAPANCIRLHKDNPCTKIGRCADCNSDTRICDAFVALKRCHEPGRIHVILVNEDLGY